MTLVSLPSAQELVRGLGRLLQGADYFERPTQLYFYYDRRRPNPYEEGRYTRVMMHPGRPLSSEVDYCHDRATRKDIVIGDGDPVLSEIPSLEEITAEEAAKMTSHTPVDLRRVAYPPLGSRMSILRPASVEMADHRRQLEWSARGIGAREQEPETVPELTSV
jgi:hypothetical protein